MINEIEDVRDAINRAFDPTQVIPGEHFVEVSPCGRYRIVVDTFGTVKDPTFPAVVVAIIQDAKTEETIATIKRNDDRLFYTWISRDGHDYFLLAEDLEGQGVVDLTERRFEGFSSKDDSFIWTEFLPSPSKSKLVVIGCYWGCDYQVVVYDFRVPMQLPLPKLAQYALPGNVATFGKWKSEDCFNMVDKHGVSHDFDLRGSELE